MEDIAAISALVLLNPGPHNRARYELAGENATLEDIASILGTVSGHTVTCDVISRDKFVGGMRKLAGASKPEFFMETFERMLYYYDKRCVTAIISLYLCLMCVLLPEAFQETQTPFDGFWEEILPL